MNPKLADGRLVDGKLLLALQRCIVETFDDARWTALGYATGTTNIVNSTYRLRQSLDWNDEDYPQRVFTLIERIVAEPDPPVLDKVVEFIGLKEWVVQNDSKLAAELYGDVVPGAVEELAAYSAIATVPELLLHARRIRSGLESDPGLAIGSAKELLETVMKTVLKDATTKDNFPTLLKRTKEALDFDSATPQPVNQMITSLMQVALSVAQLRNAAGTGHGRTRANEPASSHARLAVDCAVAASHFILDLHDHKSQASALSGPPEV
jgi:hypothetical protein